MLLKLLPTANLRNVLRRFLPSVLCSLILFCLGILSDYDVIDIEDELSGRIVGFLVCGFFLFGGLRVFAEQRSFKPQSILGLVLAAAIGLGLLIFLAHTSLMIFIYLIPALLLFVMVAPYLRGGDDVSFWVYNRDILLGALIGIAAGITLGAGVSAALLSIEYLFGIEFLDEMLSDFWFFCAVIFTPLYTLAWVPQRFEYRQHEVSLPIGLTFVVNWILAPLVITYVLILYAYFIKIAVVGQLPRGQLSYMVSVFASVGIITYMLGWPLREQAAGALKLVHKWLFIALIIPVGVQAFSIYERIAQYGVTEQRYFVAISAVWLAGVVAVFLMGKGRLKFIPMGLMVLLLLTSFGPWGARLFLALASLGDWKRCWLKIKFWLMGIFKKRAVMCLLMIGGI